MRKKFYGDPEKMFQLIKTFYLAYKIGKEQREAEKEKELQDKFWESKISFEE